jgi:hypothetical protein
MNQIAAPFTVHFAITGQTWSEPYFSLANAQRGVSCWSDKSDFIGAVIRDHKGKQVAA